MILTKRRAQDNARGERGHDVATKKEAPTGEWQDINIGDQVKHAKWGVGTVLFKSGSGDGTKVIVVFPEEGQKKLMLKYAKLKKVGTAPKAEVAAKVKAVIKATPPAPKSDEEEMLEEGVLVAPEEEDSVIVPDEVETAVFEDDEEGKFAEKDGESGG